MTLCTSTLSRSHRLALAVALFASVACGGSPAELPAPAASQGDEASPDELTSAPQEQVASEEVAPVAAANAPHQPLAAAASTTHGSSGAVMPLPAAEIKGRGSIVVTAKVNGQEVAAQVKVLDSAQPVEGTTGESITLPAGNQRISVTVLDAKALLDKPTQNLSVYVEPSKPTPVDVTFRWAKVRLDVQVGGHSQHNVPVKLIRAGAVVAELKSGQAPQTISPGKYEADVLLKGRTIHVTGLNFMESAEQTVPVRAQL